MRNSTIRLMVAGAVTAGMALTGCSAQGPSSTAGQNGPTAVTFQLNWTAGGANAGFAAAMADGIYKDAGLEVKLVEGNGSGNTAQLVSSNQSQIGYADAVAVSQLIAKGAPMKVLSTVYQSNPNEVSALKKTGIKSIKDLAGHKVAVPSGSSQTTMLPLLLEANGLKESDVTLVNMPATSLVPALLQGQVDAILGSIDSYQIQLESQGAELDNYTFADNGVPTVSTSIFASESYIKDHPDTVKTFVTASLKGWSSAMDNPDKAVKSLKSIFPNMNEKQAAAELAAIQPLFCSGGAKYVGKAEPEHWKKTQDLLSKVGLLPEGKDVKSYYTDEFLPPSAELRPCKS